MLEPRRTLLKLLSAAPLTRLFGPFARGRAAVFMLHRFRDPEAEVEGNRPGAVRSLLEYLRRERYDLLSLEQVSAATGGGVHTR